MLIVRVHELSLWARREPSDIATARIVDGGGVAAGEFAADDLASRIVVRDRA